MKKVLSFVLVLAMILSSFAMVNAASFTDVTTDDDFAPAVAVLSDLGIVNGYPDGTFGAEKVVTRAEMAKFIIEALGITPAKNAGTIFPDVPYTHWAAPYVDYCQSLGIITGYGDGTFRPDQTVTYNEAIKMVVCALGYNETALTGTYPASYVNMAMALGLLDDIQAGTAGAVRGDIAMLVYAAMGSPMVTVSKDGEISNIHNAEGVNVTMYHRHNVGYAEVVIDQTMIDKALVDVSNYFGAYAAVWRKLNDDKLPTGKIVAFEEELSTPYTFTFDDDCEDWGVYTESKDYAPTAATKIFVNGELTTTTIGAFKQKDGFEYSIAADFDGVYVDEIYSIAYWEVVEKGTQFINDEDELEDLKDEIADDDALYGFSFELDNQAKIDTDAFERVGIDTLDDFAVGDVVEIYCGVDKNGNANKGDIVKIVVTRNVVTGKVSKISSDGKEVTVAGEVYEPYDVYYLGKGVDSIKTGNEYEFYLNAAGEIVAVELVEDATQYGVIVDFGNGATGDMYSNGASANYITLLTEEGKEVTYEVKKGAVDATIFADWFVKTNAETAKKTLGKVVKYTVNNSNVITLIELPEKANIANIADKDISANGYVDTFRIADDATVFVCDDWGKTFDNGSVDYLKEYKLAVSTKKAILDMTVEKGYYILNSNKQIEYIIVNEGATSGTYGVYAGYALVDNDGTPEYEVYFYVDGEKVTYNMTSDNFKAKDSIVGKECTKAKVYNLSVKGDYLEATTMGAAKFDEGDYVTATVDKDNTFKKGTFTDKVSGLNYAIADDAVVYLVEEDADGKVSVSVEDTDLLKDEKNANAYDIYLYSTDKLDDEKAAFDGYNIIIVTNVSELVS